MTVMAVLDTGTSPAGGQGCQAPILNLCPPFHVWTSVCCIQPILYFKSVAPLVVVIPNCCEILATDLT